jgi:hypothetical protein
MINTKNNNLDKVSILNNLFIFNKSTNLNKLNKLMTNNKLMSNNKLMTNNKLMLNNKLMTNNKLMSNNKLMTNNKLMLNNKLMTNNKLMSNNKFDNLNVIESKTFTDHMINFIDTKYKKQVGHKSLTCDINNKIICVGQPKTGTKTLADIFLKLNLKTNSNPLCINEENIILLDNNFKLFIDAEYDILEKNLEYYDAFHDIPYSYNYEYIYNKYQYSKFILTIRDSEDWFKSLYNYQFIVNAVDKRIIFKLYGYEYIDITNKYNVINSYEKYNQNVINFFKDKPNSLLVINIINSDDKQYELNKIADFLNMKIDFSLSHINKQNYFLNV